MITYFAKRMLCLFGIHKWEKNHVTSKNLDTYDASYCKNCGRFKYKNYF